jgi:AhpD family alkylhydroperoxidase
MRFDPQKLEHCSWYIKPLLWVQKHRYGDVLNSALVWAKTPKLLFAISIFFGILDRKSSPLPGALRSLILVRVSQLNWCQFCIDANSATVLERGISWEKLEALAEWKISDHFDEQERLALEYAENMTLSHLEVEDDFFKRLGTEFGEIEIVELTALIAFQNMSTKFNNAFQVSPQGLCKTPNRSPLEMTPNPGHIGGELF